MRRAVCLLSQYLLCLSIQPCVCTFDMVAGSGDGNVLFCEVRKWSSQCSVVLWIDVHLSLPGSIIHHWLHVWHVLCATCMFPVTAA